MYTPINPLTKQTKLSGFLPQISPRTPNQVSYSFREKNSFSPSPTTNLGLSNSSFREKAAQTPIPFESHLATPRKQFLLPLNEKISPNYLNDSSLLLTSLSPNSCQQLPYLKISTPRTSNQKIVETQDSYLLTSKQSVTFPSIPQQASALEKTQSSLKRLDILIEQKTIAGSNPQGGSMRNLKESSFQKQNTRGNLNKFNLNLIGLKQNKDQNERETTLLKDGDYDADSTYHNTNRTKVNELTPIDLKKPMLQRRDSFRINQADEYNLANQKQLFERRDSQLSRPAIDTTNETASRFAPSKSKNSILKSLLVNKERTALEALGEMYLRGELSKFSTNLEQNVLEDSELIKYMQEDEEEKSQLEEGDEEEQDDSDDEDLPKESIAKMKILEESNKDGYLKKRRYLQVRASQYSRSSSLQVAKSEKREEQAGGEEDQALEEGVKFNKKNLLNKLQKSYKMKFIANLVSKNEKKQQQQLQKKKQKAKSNLNKILWTTVYPFLLTKGIETKVNKRKETILKEMSNNFQVCFKAAETFLISTGEKFLRNLICEPKSLELFSLDKQISEKSLDVRANLIFANLHGLFDKLIVKMSENSSLNNALTFLNSISQDYAVLPQDFLFEFELKRLQFNHYGNLKNMSPARAKMIIGSFILIRVLIHKIILRPWTVFPDVKEKKVNKKNLLTVASILYYKVVNFYKRNLPIQHNNQAFLHSHLRVKARKEPLKATDEEPEIDEVEYLKQKANPVEKEKEAISGLIPVEQLKYFFSDKKKFTDKIKAIIEGWHDKIYEIAQADCLEAPKNDMGKLDLSQEKN